MSDDDTAWSNLARHPDGTPRLVFEELAAREPDRYGEIDMPKTPPPQAPLPGHTPPPTPPPTVSVSSGPSIQVGEEVIPSQFGDGPPFSVETNRVKPDYPSLGRFVTRPVPGAKALDPAVVFLPDPSLASFVVVQDDVWEEVHVPGTSAPSYLLKWSRGQRVPAVAVQGVKALVTEQEPPFVTETK